MRGAGSGIWLELLWGWTAASWTGNKPGGTKAIWLQQRYSGPAALVRVVAELAEWGGSKVRPVQRSWQLLSVAHLRVLAAQRAQAPGCRAGACLGATTRRRGARCAAFGRAASSHLDAPSSQRI